MSVFYKYSAPIQKVFRTPIFTGKVGRPHLREWEHICIVQVIKQVSRRRVVGVIRHVAQGTSEQVESLLKQTQNTLQGHAAYIERLNGTFRSRIAALACRGRSLARQSFATDEPWERRHPACAVEQNVSTTGI